MKARRLLRELIGDVREEDHVVVVTHGAFLHFFGGGLLWCWQREGYASSIHSPSPDTQAEEGKSADDP